MIHSPPLFILVGPSGAGKSTVSKELLALPDLNLVRTITTTTRAPRPGEKDGIDFWFLSPEAFERDVKDGKFLESVETSGRRYGTNREELERRLATGHPVIITTDMDGAKAIRAQIPNTHILFLDAPHQELVRRIQERGVSEEELAGRVKRFTEEKESSKQADIIIENREGHLRETVDAIAQAIRAHS